jgi:hypothetical protein
MLFECKISEFKKKVKKRPGGAKPPDAGLCGVDGNFFAALVFALVFHDAVDKGVEGMVFAHADVVAGMDFRTALAVDDVARYDGLAADFFDAESATRGVAVVLG